MPRHALPQVTGGPRRHEDRHRGGSASGRKVDSVPDRRGRGVDRVVTLADPTARRAANDDPSGFIAGLGERAFIDELQRAPELALALKAEVDRDPRPGRFLVSGSEPAARALDWRSAGWTGGAGSATSLLAIRARAEAGVRVARWDLAGGSSAGHRGGGDRRAAHAQRIATGGFPAVVLRTPRRRGQWLRDYIAALITRDAPDLADVRRPDLLPVLLRHLAAGSGSVVALRPIAQALAIDEKTVRTYLRLLELLYIVVSVPAWAPALPPVSYGPRAS